MISSSQFVPASQLARNLGVKLLGYGGPGLGKTPIVDTAPRPVLMACEPGLRSMHKSNTPTCAAYNIDVAEDFFRWLFNSHEAAQFDTIAIDSVSEFAEMALRAELPKHKDPRKAYGEMARKVYEKLAGLYFMQQKHVYLIAKEVSYEEGAAKVRKAKPYFPGIDLNIKVPHLYDAILRMERMLNPNDGKYYSVFKTKGDDTFVGRDRSGNLGEIEMPNLTTIFQKAMA